MRMPQQQMQPTVYTRQTTRCKAEQATTAVLERRIGGIADVIGGMSACDWVCLEIRLQRVGEAAPGALEPPVAVLSR